MAAPSFEWLADRLEERTGLGRLPTRGTVRLALKKGGLEVEAVRRGEMLLVLERIVPEELTRRGVQDSEKICSDLARELKVADLATEDTTHQQPDEIFSRLFGDS